MNVPTAEEFLTEWMGESDSYHPDELVRNSWERKKNQMIAFAKLHVKGALKAASENAQNQEDHSDYVNRSLQIDKKSILDSYSLNNIT